MGQGTTALTLKLAEQFGARRVLEQHGENPYLERFYRDPSHWALHAQLAFMVGRLKQQRSLRSLDLFHQSVIADYTFDKDRIFAELNLEGEDLLLYQTLYAQMAPGTPRPDLVIFLQGSVQRAMEVIRARARAYEVDLDEGYVAALHHAYTEYFFRYTRCPLLIINTDDLDLMGNAEDFRELVHQIVKPEHFGITFLRPIQRGLFQ